MMRFRPLLLCLLLGCRSTPTPPPEGANENTTMDCQTFNRIAVELALPLFWFEDDDSAIEPDEVAVVWGLTDTKRSDWIADGRFTPRFEAAHTRILARRDAPPLTDPRLVSLTRELAQGHPTLIRTDLSDANEMDRAIVHHVRRAAERIEILHAKQNGVAGWSERVPENDTISRAVFFRNQGPWCEAPATQDDETCVALVDPPPKRSGLYPAELMDGDFCAALAARPDGEALMHHFFVVRLNDAGVPAAVPYHIAFADDVQAIATELEAAAAAIGVPSENALKTYLLAAANAFRTDDWPAADEAWAKMNANNSKWYLRIGPDETYFEPCSRKAGYHVSFARIDQSSRIWQARLDPLKAEMEGALATLAGPPYAARPVDFDLPDFIEIVLNAGDARRGLGATIGQSLPNWGPVANEGRGRTVAMTNVNTSADSIDAVERQAKSVFCNKTMKSFVKDPESLTMSTVLHEATHNLGPAHEYRVGGKTAGEVFGGPLASTLEELKAETASYFYADWLAAKGVITEADAKVAHIRDLVWGFNHISRGMYDAGGKPKAYSHLSAIHLGWFIDHGAVTWKSKERSVGGDDGCLEVDLEKLPAVVADLMRAVAEIKGRGEKERASALVAKYVDGADRQPLLETIRTRWLREPEASIYYAIEP